MSRDHCGWRSRISILKTVAQCLWPVLMVFACFAPSLWAGDNGAYQEIRESHFTFRLPQAFCPFKAEGSSLPGFPNTPWGRVHEKRAKDLDRIFVAREGNQQVLVGLKVEPYRRKLRKALTFDEFASPEKIDTFRYALAGQLAVHGLSQVDVRHFEVHPKRGIITFGSTFEITDGHKAEEYYISALGSHEIVYFILFSSPPAASQAQAALFDRLVDSIQFEQGYGYDPNPQNWWQRRTWSERIEDVTKLAALFFIVYLGCSWALGSLLGSIISNPWAMRALVVLVTWAICMAVASWTVFW